MVYASRYLRLMSPPMEGPDVRDVQKRLNVLGIYRGEANGVFDQATADAVREFQRRNGLPADGVVGPGTYTALWPGAPGGVSEFTIAIDVDRKILTLSRRQQVIKTYRVAVGKPDTPTPIGNWTIVEKALNPGGPFGVRWMRLSVPWGGYGIHGTDNPSSIGTAASHGCVRMHNEQVTELYNTVPLNTPVRITGTVFTGKILTVGSQGQDVREVQQKLTVLGYFNGDIDGVYGQASRAAVIAFQRAQELNADGVVGPQTYSAIQQAYDIALGLRQP